jgi:mannose-6-phosphate isomerase-like protein (cupin superfamily)
MNQTSAKTKGMTYSIINRADAKDAGGRRSYLDYLEMGVSKASNGFARAQIVQNKKGVAPPTGWHYHTCDAQIVYFLKGWSDLEFEDGKALRAKAGDVLFIPGGLIHNEGECSDDIEFYEVSMPAEMGTVAVDPPDGFTQVYGERVAKRSKTPA